jgi:hypothetical protein
MTDKYDLPSTVVHPGSSPGQAIHPNSLDYAHKMFYGLRKKLALPVAIIVSTAVTVTPIALQYGGTKLSSYLSRYFDIAYNQVTGKYNNQSQQFGNRKSNPSRNSRTSHQSNSQYKVLLRRDINHDGKEDHIALDSRYPQNGKPELKLVMGTKKGGTRWQEWSKVHKKESQPLEGKVKHLLKKYNAKNGGYYYLR